MNPSIYSTPRADQDSSHLDSSDYSNTSFPKSTPHPTQTPIKKIIIKKRLFKCFYLAEAISDMSFNQPLLPAKTEDSSIPGHWTRSERLKTLRRFSRMMALGSEKSQRVRDLCAICLGKSN